MKILNKKNNFKKISKLYLYKASIYLIVIIFAIVLPFQKMMENTYADQYDDQIAALQRQIDAYNAEAERLANQAATYQSQIAALQNQINTIQAEINVSQAQYDQLVAQIAETEQKIQDNKDSLGMTVAEMYVDDNITPIEMLVSSKNISDYLDKQEYRTSIRNQLVDTIDQIKKLKADLENKKIAQQEVLDKQNAQKASLQAAQAEQQSLYNQTKGEEAAYQQLVASSRQAMADAAAAQRAYLASLGGNGSGGTYGDFIWQNLYPSDGAGGCSDGYPYCQEQDTIVDQWQLYNRECVSYAAWAIYYRFGKYVSPFYGSGNAYEWEWSAPAYSGAWRVYDPQPGDAVVLPQSGFAPIGHLMVVESYSDGWIHISQYNMFGTGQYSTMDIRNSGIILLRFPNR